MDDSVYDLAVEVCWLCFRTFFVLTSYVFVRWLVVRPLSLAERLALMFVLSSLCSIRSHAFYRDKHFGYNIAAIFVTLPFCYAWRRCALKFSPFARQLINHR